MGVNFRQKGQVLFLWKKSRHKKFLGEIGFVQMRLPNYNPCFFDLWEVNNKIFHWVIQGITKPNILLLSTNNCPDLVLWSQRPQL